jgi:uncharacterized protein
MDAPPEGTPPTVLINVATLIQEPIGHARRYYAEGERVSVPEADFEQEITGEIRLIRSDRGVLVSAEFDLAPITMACARCLQEYEAPISITFDEEYVVVRDATTGQRAEVREDEFTIDGTWHLDLSEAVRQYEESALPIQALCRPDCRGLCPRCGQNLNESTCGCNTAAGQDRWSSLAALAEQLRIQEEQHGSPEA